MTKEYRDALDQLKASLDAIPATQTKGLHFKITTEGRAPGGPGPTGGGSGGRAAGGPVSMGSSYIVGEEGPEIFVPNSSGYIIPNDRASRGSGRSTGRMGSSNNYYSIRYGDQNIVTNPAQAAFLVEKQRQAQFDKIDRVI